MRVHPGVKSERLSDDAGDCYLLRCQAIHTGARWEAESEGTGTRGWALTASCSASKASPWTKRHRCPYGHRPVLANDRQALVLYEEG